MKTKNATNDGANRLSVLKRLSGPTSMSKSVHQRISAPTTSTITDARQLLSNRNKPAFDARQLLSRQSSKTKNISLVVRHDVESDEEDDNQETIVLQRSNTERVSGEYSFIFAHTSIIH